MNNKKTASLVFASVVAGLYVAITVAQELLFPGTTSAVIQFRASEALCVLALFSPSAVWGLTLGCFVSNLIFFGALPTDIIFGTLASFLSAFFMYKTRKILIKNLPFVSLLMPAVFNGIIVGFQLEVFFIHEGFHFSSFLSESLFVFLGEIGVLYTLGILLYKTIKKSGTERYFPSV